MALRGMGRGADAASSFHEALQIRDDYVAAYYALATHFEDIGDRDAAIRLLDRALERVPDSQPLADKRRSMLGGN